MTTTSTGSRDSKPHPRWAGGSTRNCCEMHSNAFLLLLHSEFPPITTVQQRSDYKHEFDRDHQEYKDLQAELDAINKNLADVDRELDELQENSPQYLVTHEPLGLRHRGGGPGGSHLLTPCSCLCNRTL